MNNKLKLLTQIIFYGSIWGIIEATLGHVLHFIPVTIAGSIMFPIAGSILYKAYQKTNSKASLFYIGVVAATIKSVDFFLPAISIYKTINPMMSILMEAVVVVVVVGLLVSKKPVQVYSSLIIASVLWRTLFVGWMGVQYQLTGNLAPYITSASNIAQFVLISGLLSGVLASGLLYLVRIVRLDFKWDSKPLFASVLLVIAWVVTYTL